MPWFVAWPPFFVFRHKRILAVIAHVRKPVMEWANEANRDLRKGVQGNQAWLVEQMQDKLYSRMHDIFEQLFDQEFLHDAGFLTTRTQNITGWTDEDIQHEDTFATLAGRFATGYCMDGARHTLYLWGHPQTWHLHFLLTRRSSNRRLMIYLLQMRFG